MRRSLNPGYLPVGRVVDREITSRALRSDSGNRTSATPGDIFMAGLKVAIVLAASMNQAYACGKHDVKCLLQEKEYTNNNYQS